MRYKQVIVVRKDLKISCGKMAVQVAHASLEAAELVKNRNPELYKEWKGEGAKKVVLSVESEGELFDVYRRAQELGIPSVLVRDAGLTEVPPGTPTAVGIGPDREERIDRITGRLRLYK